jgi:hypothetical protein
LYDNQLSRQLPSTLGNILSLSALALNGNHFSGTIPVSLQNLTRLCKY